MLEKIRQLFKSRNPKEVERHARIDAILQRYDGRLGVYKRLDENRELLQLIQKEAPQLLLECPWIDGWIGANDRFFVALEACVDPKFKERIKTDQRRVREWPCVSERGYRPEPSAFLAGKTGWPD